MGKKGLVILAVTCFVFLLLYFGFLQIQIIRYSQVEVEEDVDYVMILGARVMGSTPSLSLQYRIDTAAEYLLKNKKAIAIATGGRGPGEDITEAEAIKKELVKKGIEESRIFLEDQSTSTKENIGLAKVHFPTISTSKGLIVTNRYHVYRAILTAQDHQLEVMGLSAKTPRAVLVQSYLREYLAISKHYITKLFS